MEQSKTAVAVVGAGAFGRNHARVYRDLEQQGEAVHLAAVVDIDLQRAEQVASEFGAKAFVSISGMLAELPVQAASVTVPTVGHKAAGVELMQGGVDVLIEKPIAATIEEADALIEVAVQTQRVAQVGHLERFNAAVQATLPLVTRPMFFEAHRLSVFSPRALDVDVVLDLMIHDLDIVLSFVRSPVKEIRAVGLPVLSPKVDIANVRMEFESGCVANFTASRISTERVRKLRFFQPRQYVSIDYSRQDVVVFTVEDGGEAGVTPSIGIAKPETQQGEPLLAELRSFLQAVRKRGEPVVSLQEGRRALRVAFEILDEIKRHGGRAGLSGVPI
jgi:predicted dehydrogenase